VHEGNAFAVVQNFAGYGRKAHYEKPCSSAARLMT